MQHRPDRPFSPLPSDPATDEALDWFLRLREDSTPATAQAFDRWRGQDAAHDRAFAAVQATWGASALHLASAPAVPPVRRGWAVGVALAAMLALAAMIGPGVLLWMRSDYRTAAGESLVQTLPDGSSVTLNTASAIAIDFDQGRRDVSLLEGEAFFSVARDPQHPFIVTTRYGQIRVTGTQFGVRLDGDGDLVLLREGHVRVTHDGDGQMAELAPGDSVSLRPEGLSGVSNSGVAEGLAWLDGRIEVQDQTVARAVADLARYRGGTVVFLPTAAKDRRVSGIFTTRDPDAGIRTLAASAGLSVRRVPGAGLILY
ncbi:MAG: FecR domain-containing protein [Paracoccaceae bacterium]